MKFIEFNASEDNENEIKTPSSLNVSALHKRIIDGNMWHVALNMKFTISLSTVGVETTPHEQSLSRLEIHFAVTRHIQRFSSLHHEFSDFNIYWPL